MEVVVPFTTKTLHGTVPTEFIIIRNTGDVGFIIDIRPDASRTVAVLRSGAEPAHTPHWTSYPADIDCVSYGTDWVFELVPPAIDKPFVPDADRYANGMCTVSGDEVFIQLGRDPYNIRTTGAYFNLRTLALAHQPVGGGQVAVGRWRIWLNQREREDVTKTPLLSFGF